MIKQKILVAYSEGSTLEYIAESFEISKEKVKEILIEHKEESRLKKSFTDEFKIMISERDLNGIARAVIASELELNINTIRKACEKFGQALKDRALNDNAFTKIDGEFTMDTCPSCGSKRNNKVDENTTFCRDCDSEHEYYDGYVMKVNFEYLD